MTSGCWLYFKHNTHFLTLFTLKQMLLYLCVWHLHLTMQTLVGFAETGNKPMIKLLPICKGALNIVCVTETASRRHNRCPAEVRRAPSCRWADVGGSWPMLTIARRWPFPPAVTTTSHLPEGPGVLSLENPDEENPIRKWALVNPCCFGRREGARDQISRRMWPLARSSWKRWHFNPPWDSIPERSSRLPLSYRKAYLPKKELIWHFLCSLNWLTTASEKCQDKVCAGKGTRAAFGSSCPWLRSPITPHSRTLTGSGTQTRQVLWQALHRVLEKGYIPCSWIHTNNLKSLNMCERTETYTFPSIPALKRCKLIETKLEQQN